MFVTISGTAASGKSTVGKLLAARLGYRYVSMGSLSREMAAKQGISLEELNRRSEADPHRDEEIDSYQRRLGEIEDDMVVDGRMSFHFIPHSIKVYIDCALDERARRIFAAQREDEHFTDIEQAKEKLVERQHSDTKRYLTYYGLDCFDYSHYDLVVQSHDKTPEQIVDEIILFIKERG